MQVTETLNEGLKRGYNIVMTAAELDEKVDTKLKETQPEVTLKGFRKGKVPMALLRKQFGKQIIGEAMQEGIDDAMKSHFADSGDRPAQNPNVEMKNGETWKEGDDVEIEMSYERMPDIPDVDFKKIKLERLTAKIEDEAVDEALDNLAKNAQNFEDRKKGSKAKDGDQLVINFLGRVDGEAFEGGTAEDYPLVLGSNSFIPGFEEQLVGAKADDELDVKVTFPAEYGAENLAGKDAVFECKVTAVKAPKAADIDDELAKQFGAEDLAGLKTQLNERLTSEYGAAARQVMKRGLLDALAGELTFDLPPSLVETEASQIAHSLWHDENPDVQGHDHPEIETTDEHKDLAKRRVGLGLMLAEIGAKNELTIGDQEMQQAVFQEAQKYPGQEREFFEFVQKNEQMQQQLRAPLFEDKVVDFIFELATVSDKEVSKDDLQKAIEALGE
jgi:trigger factor